MLNVKQAKEIGRRVKGFENQYAISSYGRISNFKKILKPYVINSGYETIKFTVNGKRTSHLVHRLVATAFLPNPENKKEVNHIDGNKMNNNVSNLEWVTSTENKKHARTTGLSEYNIPTLGKKIGKTSQYYNVTYDKYRDRYIAQVRCNGVNHGMKRFSEEREAALHVNTILDQLGLSDRSRNLLDN